MFCCFFGSLVVSRSPEVASLGSSQHFLLLFFFFFLGLHLFAFFFFFFLGGQGHGGQKITGFWGHPQGTSRGWSSSSPNRVSSERRRLRDLALISSSQGSMSRCVLYQRLLAYIQPQPTRVHIDVSHTINIATTDV